MALSIAYFGSSDLGMAVPVGKDKSQEQVTFSLLTRISRAHLENLPAVYHLF